jgi:hypothetical protein
MHKFVENIPDTSVLRNLTNILKTQQTGSNANRQSQTQPPSNQYIDHLHLPATRDNSSHYTHRLKLSTMQKTSVLRRPSPCESTDSEGESCGSITPVSRCNESGGGSSSPVPRYHRDNRAEDQYEDSEAGQLLYQKYSGDVPYSSTASANTSTHKKHSKKWWGQDGKEPTKVAIFVPVTESFILLPTKCVLRNARAKNNSHKAQKRTARHSEERDEKWSICDPMNGDYDHDYDSEYDCDYDYDKVDDSY